MQTSRTSSASQEGEGSSRAGSSAAQDASAGAEPGHEAPEVSCAVCLRSWKRKWNLTRHVFTFKHFDWTEAAYNARVQERRQADEEEEATTGVPSTRSFPFLSALRHSPAQSLYRALPPPSRTPTPALEDSALRGAGSDGVAFGQGGVDVHIQQPVVWSAFIPPSEGMDVDVPQSPLASTPPMGRDAVGDGMAPQQAPDVTQQRILLSPLCIPGAAMPSVFQQEPEVVEQPLLWSAFIPSAPTDASVPPTPLASTPSMHEDADIDSDADAVAFHQGSHVIHQPVPRRPPSHWRAVVDLLDASAHALDSEAGSLSAEPGWDGTLMARAFADFWADRGFPSTALLPPGSALDGGDAPVFPDCPPSPAYFIDFQEFDAQALDIVHEWAFVYANTEMDMETDMEAEMDTEMETDNVCAVDEDCPYAALIAYLAEQEGREGVVSGW